MASKMYYAKPSTLCYIPVSPLDLMRWDLVLWHVLFDHLYIWHQEWVPQNSLDKIHHMCSPSGERKGGEKRSSGLPLWLIHVHRFGDLEFPKVFIFCQRTSLHYCGRDPFNQNFRKFRSKTQWIGSVQLEKFRKNGFTFWGGPLLPVGPFGILVEWIAPCILIRDKVRKIR